MTAWPEHVFATPLPALMLPSMKIVPLTVSAWLPASHDSCPPAVVHEYDVAGVRSNTVATLLLRTVSLSKTGTLPLDVVHGAFGPGDALAYHRSHSGVGGVSVGTAESATDA